MINMDMQNEIYLNKNIIQILLNNGEFIFRSNFNLEILKRESTGNYLQWWLVCNDNFPFEFPIC